MSLSYRCEQLFEHVQKQITSSPLDLLLPLLNKPWPHVIVLTFCCVSFCRFVLLWFHNGSCSESDRPFPMGLQDIWRKRLQESHNHFQGTHQHLPFSWTLGHLIKTYPLLANPVMVWHRLSVSLLWHFFLIFVFSVNFIPISFTTKP